MNFLPPKYFGAIVFPPLLSVENQNPKLSHRVLCCVVLRKRMSSSNHEDLDLLLSLHDRVPETPPASPSPLDADDDAVSYKHREKPDMSVFRDAVQDCLHSQPSNSNPKSITKPLTDDPQLDKFSGLRITNQCLTPAELRESVQDIRFVRLPVIKYSSSSSSSIFPF